MTPLSTFTFNWLNIIALGVTAAASGAEPEAEPIAIHRTAGPIAIDGDLSDEGWKGALRVDTGYGRPPVFREALLRLPGIDATYFLITPSAVTATSDFLPLLSILAS